MSPLGFFQEEDLKGLSRNNHTKTVQIARSQRILPEVSEFKYNLPKFRQQFIPSGSGIAQTCQSPLKTEHYQEHRTGRVGLFYARPGHIAHTAHAWRLDF